MTTIVKHVHHQHLSPPSPSPPPLSKQYKQIKKISSKVRNNISKGEKRKLGIRTTKRNQEKLSELTLKEKKRFFS
jgi:hypothetical protein